MDTNVKDGERVANSYNRVNATTQNKRVDSKNTKFI